MDLVLLLMTRPVWCSCASFEVNSSCKIVDTNIVYRYSNNNIKVIIIT